MWSVWVLWPILACAGQAVTRSELDALYAPSGAQVRYSSSPSPSTLPVRARDDTTGGYTILAARGTGENQTDPNGSRAFVGRILASVMGGDAYEVLYPATFNFATDPEIGAADLLRHIALIQSRTRDRKFVLYGYCRSFIPTLAVLLTRQHKGSWS